MRCCTYAGPAQVHPAACSRLQALPVHWATQQVLDMSALVVSDFCQAVNCTCQRDTAAAGRTAAGRPPSPSPAAAA